MRLVAKLSSWLAGTDEEAMRRVQQHDDHAAFARLVKRWEQPIRRLCTRMTGEPERAEDLTQETFLRLFTKRKEYRPVAKFSTYLWRIALNQCYDELRRRQRRREFLLPQTNDPEEDLEAPSEIPGPDLQAATLEEGELVRNALLRLPDIYRAVIVLRHYESLKLGRIAEVLDIPEGTVNSRLAEALSRLSRMLQPKLQRQSPRAAEQSCNCYEPSKP